MNQNLKPIEDNLKNIFCSNQRKQQQQFNSLVLELKPFYNSLSMGYFIELGEMGKFENTEKLKKITTIENINKLPLMAKLFYFMLSAKEKLTKILRYPKLKNNQLTRITKLVKNSNILKQEFKGFWFIQKEDILNIELAKYKNRRYSFIV